MTFDFSQFVTLSHHNLQFDEVIAAIYEFTREDLDHEYRVILGTDSEGYGNVAFASAIVVHRVGAGGRAFICKNTLPTHSLRQKIYNEATLSIALAHELMPRLTELLGEKFIQENLIIHVDIGQKGETRDMISEVTGMVRGSGFKVEIKPDSFAASSVADLYAKPPKYIDREQANV